MNEENLKAIREKLSKETEKSTEKVADLDQNFLKEKLMQFEAYIKSGEKIQELEKDFD